MGIDYLLKDGLVIDGTGKDAEIRQADIALEGDRIKAIGKLSDIRAEKTISIKDLIVCPGFIDAHSHSEFTLLADGRAEGKICQGITTEINGNCGLSAAPLYGAALEHRGKDLDELGIKDRWNNFEEYFSLLEKRKFSVNFFTLVGHGNIRASVTGYSDKVPVKADMSKMTELLRTAMLQGAKGLSTGLIYPPGIYSDTSEIIELALEAGKHKGLYTTHMRSEGDMLLESVDEVIRIAEGSKIRVHISHLKTSEEKNWGKLGGVFERIDMANKNGLSVTCDRYPYIASSTDLDALLPSWAFEGGRKREIERLKTEQEKLEKDFLTTHPEASLNPFWDNIIISSVETEKNRWMEGEMVSSLSRALGKTPLKCVFDLLVEERLNVGGIFFLMSEENLKAILKKPYTMIGTDSSARSYDGTTAKGKPHPRGFGSFPRVLGKYVREQGELPLNEAVYKMTGLPAKTFRLKRRGIIAEDYFADITVFDPSRINDTAGFNSPFQKPEGIHHVFVNGIPVLLNGETTGVLPGRILK